MNTILVSIPHNRDDEQLQARLQRTFGQVSHYCRGRRLSGGPVHMAEAWLKRFAPEFLLHQSTFCLPTPGALVADILDELLSLVSRLDDPTQVKVEIVPVGQLLTETRVGSAGE